MQKKDELDEAVRLLKEKEYLCREIGDRAGIASSLGQQGIILIERGQLDTARTLLKEQQRISSELKDVNGVVTSLSNQAYLIGWKMGKWHEALPLAEEAYRVASAHGYYSSAEQIKSNIKEIRSRIGV